MRYRRLGKTELKVSVVSFGTTELGMDYGIKAPGDYGKPDKQAVKRILHKALDYGINFFDTAPGYGDSEKLLGDTLGSEPCYIATKINVDERSDLLSIKVSIGNSLKRLKRECIDVVQIHNATSGVIGQSEILENLKKLRKEGLVRFFGASVYEPSEALRVIKEDFFDSLQVAFNIMDQRILDEVVPLAVKNNTSLISRSAYFRGILTKKITHLDDNWVFLKNAANKIKNTMNISGWNDLTKLALRFCLSTKGLSTVLVGIRTMDELMFAIEVEKEGKLSNAALKKLSTLRVNDEYWLNPLNWYRKL